MTAIKFFQLNQAEKNEIFLENQKDIPLPTASIEKDWWVVQTLDVVFKMEAAPHLVFKGGTSLSKAWGIIERFSEDVDLALSRNFWGSAGKSAAHRLANYAMPRLNISQRHSYLNFVKHLIKMVFLAWRLILPK